MALLAATLLCPITASAQSLPMVAGVAYDGTQISWDSLEGATGYNVYFAAPGAGWVYTETIGVAHL